LNITEGRAYYRVANQNALWMRANWNTVRAVSLCKHNKRQWLIVVRIIQQYCNVLTPCTTMGGRYTVLRPAVS
jgi:hypothetical protein